MYRLALASVLLCFALPFGVLAGCASGPTLTIPESRDPRTGGRLAVVVLGDSAEVEDADRLAEPVPLAAGATYLDVAVAAWLPKLDSMVTFGRVERDRLAGDVALTPTLVRTARGPSVLHRVRAPLPPAGQPLPLAGGEADFVLLLSGVEILPYVRGTAPPTMRPMGPGGAMTMEGGGQTRTGGVTHAARVVLWDNRTGQAVYAEEIEGEGLGRRRDPLGITGREVTPEAWDAAALDLVEKLVRGARLAREERERR